MSIGSMLTFNTENWDRKLTIIMLYQNPLNVVFYYAFSVDWFCFY